MVFLRDLPAGVRLCWTVDQAVNQVAAIKKDISSRVVVGEQVPIGEALSLLQVFWKAGLRNARFMISNMENGWDYSGKEPVRELVVGPLFAMDTYEQIWAAQPDWVQSPEIHYSHDYDHLGWKPIVPGK